MYHQPFNNSFNYYIPPQPTSSHYLPPPSQQQSMQSMQVLQPTMIGMVAPPQQQSQPPPVQPSDLVQQEMQPNFNHLMMAPQMNHAMPIYHPMMNQMPLQGLAPLSMVPSVNQPIHQGQMGPHANQTLQGQPQPQIGGQPQVGGQVPGGEVTGGINSVLEYDLNNMSTFLSWCTFGMLKQNRNPSKDFENLVNSVLIATRLPKSTIIISLEYLNQRFSKKSLDSFSESEIFIKLIISLILGNKFNDDNTFTNKSWSGATGLDINLINFEEKNWLMEINYDLNVVKFESNILTLEECWKTWLDKYSDNNSPSSPSSISQLNSHTNDHSISLSNLNNLNTSPGYNYQSIPSSPISNYYLNNSNSNFTSPISPLKDSIWSQGNQPSGPSQQNRTQIQLQNQGLSQQNPPQGQGPILNNLNQPLNGNIWSYNYNDSVPIQFNSNFVGYTNPYYAFNMASC